MLSACVAVSLSDADISFSPLSASSRERAWMSAPCATSSVMRAMSSAAALTSTACAVIRCASSVRAVAVARGCLLFRSALP